MSSRTWQVMRRELDRNVLIANYATEAEARAALRDCKQADSESDHWIDERSDEVAPEDIAETRVPIAQPRRDLPLAIIASEREQHQQSPREHRLDRDLSLGVLWRLTFDRDLTWVYDAGLGLAAMMVSVPLEHHPAWPRALIAVVCLVGFWTLRIARTRKYFTDGYLVHGRGAEGFRRATGYTFDFAGKTYTSMVATQPSMKDRSYHLLVMPRFLDYPLALETLNVRVGDDGNLAWTDAPRTWRLALPLVCLGGLLLLAISSVL
jgi:hypothetical protein